MNEMTLLQSLGTEFAPADLQPPEPMRARTLARLQADLEARPAGPPLVQPTSTQGVPQPASSMRRISGRRVLRRRPVLLMTAAAAVVTGALIVAPTIRLGPHGSAPGTTAAAEILGQAARAAQASPALQVPPGSYVFTEGTSHTDRGVEGTDPAPQSWDQRMWLPAGSSDADGLLEQRPHGAKKWGRSILPGDIRNRGAYRDDLPTSTSQMLRYLYRVNADAVEPGQSTADDEAWAAVSEVLNGSYLPPAQLAALYRAAARIPGTRVYRGQQDALHRPAIGIGLPLRGCKVGAVLSPRSPNSPRRTYCATYELLLDPVTFDLRGAQTVLTQQSELGPVGKVVAYGINHLPAIVSRPGELPPLEARLPAFW